MLLQSRFGFNGMRIATDHEERPSKQWQKALVGPSWRTLKILY
jgi:hypothetical protein